MKKIIWIIIIGAVLWGGYYFLSSPASNPQISKDQKVVVDPKIPKNYTDPDLGFGFSYPGDYTSSVINDGDIKTILIQKDGKGMQLYVAPYDGAVVSSLLIKREIKDVKVENLKDIESPNGIKATTFYYNDSSLGGVWNVWFSRDKKIFQLVAQADHEEAIKMFVETFVFE